MSTQHPLIAWMQAVNDTLVDHLDRGDRRLVELGQQLTAFAATQAPAVTPDRCPTCGSDKPCTHVIRMAQESDPCPDTWHDSAAATPAPELEPYKTVAYQGLIVLCGMNEPHRADGWTTDMLPPGTRPLCKGEKIDRSKDEVLGHDCVWDKPAWNAAMATDAFRHLRTTRPAPTPPQPKPVPEPPSDIAPDSKADGDQAFREHIASERKRLAEPTAQTAGEGELPTLRWHRLSELTRSDVGTVELLAAACCDGIGVIARWTRRDDGGWDVEAWDTEQQGAMESVTNFVANDGECVPPEPPTVFDDLAFAQSSRTEETSTAWRCFHCDEVFTDPSSARAHFGSNEGSEAACRIKAGAEGSLLNALRDTERAVDEAWSKLHNESSDIAVAMRSQAARHSAQLRAAEELGYGRGLQAAQSSREQKINTRCPACNSQTLVIGSGGLLVCSLIGCPNPTLINGLPRMEQPSGGEMPSVEDLVALYEYTWQKASHPKHRACISAVREACMRAAGGESMVRVLQRGVEASQRLLKSAEQRAETAEQTIAELRRKLAWAGIEGSPPPGRMGRIQELEQTLADLRRENAGLVQWKESAMTVMAPYQDIARELNITLGASIHDKILPGIQKLKADLTAVREAYSARVAEINQLLRDNDTARESLRKAEEERDAAVKRNEWNVKQVQVLHEGLHAAKREYEALRAQSSGWVPKVGETVRVKRTKLNAEVMRVHRQFVEPTVILKHHGLTPYALSELEPTPPPSPEEQERKEFEKWAKERHYDMDMSGGEYNSNSTEYTWRGWLAARKSEGEQP